MKKIYEEDQKVKEKSKEKKNKKNEEKDDTKNKNKLKKNLSIKKEEEEDKKSDTKSNSLHKTKKEKNKEKDKAKKDEKKKNKNRHKSIEKLGPIVSNIVSNLFNKKKLEKALDKLDDISFSDFSDLDDATIVVNHDGDNITKVLVNNKEIETNVFDPIFEQFGSIFNDDFVNNFKQNFSSSIGANYYDNIQTIVNNNQEYAKKHKKSGVKDGILGKLKKFKLTKKYCKADKDGKVELPSCCICLSEIGKGKETIMLPCAHMFHSKCCLNWLKDNNTCPMCRFEIKQ